MPQEDHIDTGYTPITVVVLTLNEGDNIEACLQNVANWTDEIHIIDSFSTDKTIEIAKKYTDNIHLSKDHSLTVLRNWALENIQHKYEWLIFLDADEYFTNELKQEIKDVITSQTEYSAFYFKRRFIFIGRWLKHGALYVNILRMFKVDRVYYIEDVEGLEKPVIDGKVGYLKHDMIHLDRRPFSRWIQNHNTYSDNAALKYYKKEEKTQYAGEIEGGRRTKFKENTWIKIPLFLQPIIMFIHRYIWKRGFLDGYQGLIFHSMQSLWFRSLIAVKYYELQYRRE